MPIEFECPECESTIRVKDSAAGKTGRCPKCRVLLMVPDPSEWEDEEEVEEEPEEQAEHAEQTEQAPEQEPAGVPQHESGSTPDSALDDATSAPSAESAPSPATPRSADTSEFAPDTVVSPFPGVEAAAGAAEEAPNPPDDAPPPASTEVMTNPPERGTTETALPAGDPASAALSRVRSRRRKGRASAARKLSIASAVGAIFIVFAAGGGLYWYSLPDLSGPIEGQRLAEVDFAEVSAPLPYDDVSEDVLETVQSDIGSEGFPPLNSVYVLVTIYAGDEELDIAIAPGPDAVPVRVRLADDPDIRAALKSVEKSINRRKQDRLSSATAGMFENYPAFLEDGKLMTKYRDNVALNSAVGTVGFAVKAFVRNASLPCVYQDAEGYCYFMIPKGIKTFQIRGRQIFGKNEDAPLPVDFQVTLADHNEPVEASRTPPAEESEDTEEEPAQDEKETEEPAEKEESNADKAKMEKSDEEGKPADEADEPSE